MYPYIPDVNNDRFEALKYIWEREFEKNYPHIDLNIDFADPAKVYDIASLKSWLEGGKYDVVEIDALLLGELAAGEAIRAWDVNQDKFVRAARIAGTYDESLFGVPHLLCSYFVYSQFKDIEGIVGFNEMIKVFESVERSVPNIVGSDLFGGLSLVSLYLDSHRDTFPSVAVEHAAVMALNSKVLDNMSAFFYQCQWIDGDNPCLQNQYSTEHVVGMLFSKRANSIVGYSEILHHVVKHDDFRKNDLAIIPLMLGQANKPVVFADVFVLGKNCVAGCSKAAHQFVEFMNRRDILEYMMFSYDAHGDAPPRYVIPTTVEAFESLKNGSDVHYQKLIGHLQNASAYPNFGVLQLKSGWKNEIASSIRKNLSNTGKAN